MPNAVGLISTVDLTILDLDDPRVTAGLGAPDTLLSESERVRAVVRVNALDRSRFLIAHMALRKLIVTAGARIKPGSEYDRSETGKPFLRDGPWFSFSCSDRFAIVAISHNRPIGVDIERVRSVAFPPDWQTRHPALKRVTQNEVPIAHEFLRAWTRLEAVAKRDDIPLSTLLDQASPSFRLGQISDLQVTQGYLAALAVDDGQIIKTRFLGAQAINDD